MEAYTSTLGPLTHSLTHWSVCIMLLYPIWSLSPGSWLVFKLWNDKVCVWRDLCRNQWPGQNVLPRYSFFWHRVHCCNETHVINRSLCVTVKKVIFYRRIQFFKPPVDWPSLSSWQIKRIILCSDNSYKFLYTPKPNALFFFTQMFKK